MNTFYLRVISSNKIFFEGRVEKIILPLEDGEKAVLAHHENMVIATSIGEIRITTSKGEPVSVLDFPYFPKISCFLAASKYII